MTSLPDDQPTELSPHDTHSEPSASSATEKRAPWRGLGRVRYLLLAMAVLVPAGILLVAHTTDSTPRHPQFSKFTSGKFTSGYGTRWGVQHLGVDIAGPTGTPILAVQEGTVIEAGNAAGMGIWVRLRHEDDTVTIYSHLDGATVSPGQHVYAGDQIATLGNTGFSSAPHCHFEVWLHGRDKTDPVPWLAARGVDLGPLAP